MNDWINNWRPANYKNIKNADLFRKLDELASSFVVPPIFVNSYLVFFNTFN